MTVKEYLGQAYRLKNRIRILKERIEELQALATSVSSPGFEEHYNASRNIDAPFVKTVEKIMAYQNEVDEKLRQLLDLEKEILDAIETVENADQRLVLTYRYINNKSWYKIGEEMNADESTIRRWHNKALANIKIPEKKNAP